MTISTCKILPQVTIPRPKILPQVTVLVGTGRVKPTFGSRIMGLAAKDAKTAKNMQLDRVSCGLSTS